MIRTTTTAALLFGALLAAEPAIADEDYGPYRYRSGAPEAHARIEDTVRIDGRMVSQRICVSMVENGRAGPTECADYPAIPATRTADALEWDEEGEHYRLDLASGRLFRRSHGVVVADVAPGAADWADTPLSN